MIVLEQFADHRRDRVGLRGSADGLQIAAGAESAAFAFDHQHPDIVRGLDLGAELLELLCDRKIDRVEAAGRFSVMVAIGPSILSRAGRGGII